MNPILGDRLARVIEHMTSGDMADLLTGAPPDVVEDYRWCRAELTAIYHQLTSPIPVVEESSPHIH